MPRKKPKQKPKQKLRRQKQPRLPKEIKETKGIKKEGAVQTETRVGVQTGMEGGLTSDSKGGAQLGIGSGTSTKIGTAKPPMGPSMGQIPQVAPKDQAPELLSPQTSSPPGTDKKDLKATQPLQQVADLKEAEAKAQGGVTLGIFYKERADSYSKCMRTVLEGHLAIEDFEDDFGDDFEEAMEYYLQAAKLGNAEAQYILGILYEDDDVEKAKRYNQQAAAQGHKKAQERTQFLQCKIAAASGNANDLYHLGNLYLKGEGVKRDLQEAIVHFREAAKKGHILALFALASGHEAGWDGRRAPNIAAAISYYKEAARLGDAESQAILNELAGESKKEVALSVEKGGDIKTSTPTLPSAPGTPGVSSNLSAFFSTSAGRSASGSSSSVAPGTAVTQSSSSSSSSSSRASSTASQSSSSSSKSGSSIFNPSSLDPF